MGVQELRTDMRHNAGSRVTKLEGLKVSVLSGEKKENHSAPSMEGSYYRASEGKRDEIHRGKGIARAQE